MESVRGFRVTYWVKFPWNTEQVTRYFLHEADAVELYEPHRKAAVNSMAHNTMPTLDPAMFIRVDDEHYYLGAAVMFIGGPVVVDK